MCIFFVRFVFLDRLDLMLTRVEMIDEVESFLEGQGFEFKCLEVKMSRVSKYMAGEGSAGGNGGKRRSA